MIKNGSSIGDYTVDRILSEQGGMSIVYLAHHNIRKTTHVAIKVHRNTDKNHNAYEEMLRTEALNLVKLRHPGVVRVFPIHHVSGRISYSAKLISELEGQPWYFVMEYLSGGNLANQVERIANEFPLLWTVELFYQLLTTVQFLHRAGYGHCDLKPQNILFRQQPTPDAVPQPVLIDFGTIQPVDKRITYPARSLFYSPPEIIIATQRSDTAMELDPLKIDIWMLGSIFFEMITGRRLFNQEAKKEITTSILKLKLSKIKDLRPKASESLDIFLKNVLMKDAKKRPDIDELIEAIEERISSIRPPRL